MEETTTTDPAAVVLSRDAFDAKCEAALEAAGGDGDAVYVLVYQMQGGAWPEVARVPYIELDEGAIARQYGGGTFRFQARLKNRRGTLAEKTYALAVAPPAAAAAPAAPAAAPAPGGGFGSPKDVPDGSTIGLFLHFISDAMREQKAATERMISENRQLVRDLMEAKKQEPAQIRDMIQLAKELGGKGGPNIAETIAAAVAQTAASITAAVQERREQNRGTVRVVKRPPTAGAAGGAAAPAAPAPAPQLAAPAAAGADEEPGGVDVAENLRAAFVAALGAVESGRDPRAESISVAFWLSQSGDDAAGILAMDPAEIVGFIVSQNPEFVGRENAVRSIVDRVRVLLGGAA